MSNQDGLQNNQGRKVIDDKQLKKLLSQSKPSFYDKNKHQIVTLALIAVNLVIYIIESVLSGFSATISVNVLFGMGAMYAPAIQSAADLYRFITPMFLHLDLMHIAFNMAALYSLGGLLERVLGRSNFLLLYFISGITGNLATYIYDAYITGVATISAGASTSVFGLFVAVAMLGVLHKHNRSYFRQIGKGVIAIIVVNIVYTFLMPGVSVSGHFGGALGGLIAIFMVPSKNLRVPMLVRILVALAWLGSLAYFLIHQGLIL